MLNFAFEPDSMPQGIAPAVARAKSVELELLRAREQVKDWGPAAVQEVEQQQAVKLLWVLKNR